MDEGQDLKGFSSGLKNSTELPNSVATGNPFILKLCLLSLDQVSPMLAFSLVLLQCLLEIRRYASLHPMQVPCNVLFVLEYARFDATKVFFSL